MVVIIKLFAFVRWGMELNLTLEELKDRTSAERLYSLNLLNKDSKEYKDLTSNEKRTLVHLVRAAWIIDKIHYKLENEHNEEFLNYLNNEIKNGSEEARLTKVLFEAQKSMFSPDFHGNKVELAKNVKSGIGLNFYPEDLTPQRFQEVVSEMLKNNEVEQLQKILSARTVVRWQGDKLVGIDYIDYFPEFQQVADEIDKAAEFCEDEKMKYFLELQALALREANPNLDALADIEWAKLDNSKLEFTITRETYDDGMTESLFDNAELIKAIKDKGIEINTKDCIGARVGIVNLEGTKYLQRLMRLCDIAKQYMPFADEYTSEIKQDKQQTAVDVDLITLTGDEGAFQAGIVLAQNLPNNDKPSIKMGGGRRNVYHRQVRSNSNKSVINSLLHSDIVAYHSTEAGHWGTICHENTHSLGPTNASNKLGKYSSIIEEFKADMGIYAFLHEFVEAGMFTEEQAKQIIVTEITGSFVKAKPTMQQAHRVRSVMIVNRMVEEKAVWLEDGKINLDFEKVISTSKEMMKEVIRLQIDKDVAGAEAYVNRYFNWTPELQAVAKIQLENDKRLNGTLVEPLAKMMLLDGFENQIEEEKAESGAKVLDRERV